MKNNAFILKTEHEKQQKLDVILRDRAHNALTEEQLRYLQLSVLLNQQYTIKIHTSQESFCDALVLVKSGDGSDTGKIVFGQALFGCADNVQYRAGKLFANQTAAAIVVKRRNNGTRFTVHNAIHIYVPQHLYARGVNKAYEQGQAKTRRA